MRIPQQTPMTTVTAEVPGAKKEHQCIQTAFGKELYSTFLQQCHLPAVIKNQRVTLEGEICKMFKPEPVARASHNHLLGFLLPLQNLFGKGLCCNMCSSYRVLIPDCNLASWQEMLVHIKRNSLAHPYQPIHPHIVAAAQHTLCFQWSPVDHRTDLVNHAHLLSMKARSMRDVFWPFILLSYKIHK